MAGISAETPDPEKGLIERELPGAEPTGLLFGMNAYLSEHVIPPLGGEELDRGIALANQSLLKHGITPIQDATASNDLARWQVFAKLKEEGKLIPRVCMMLGLDALAEFKEQGMCPRYGDDELRLGMVKISIDETRGRLNPPQEELNEDVMLGHRAGFQVAVHAIEESTVEAAATALEYALREVPVEGHRHRVEHCSVCPPHLLQRLTGVNAMIVTQPAFIYYSGERYCAEVAATQLPWLYRTRSFLASGLRTAAGSDAPVVPPNPLVGIYAAATRRAENGEVVSAQEAVSPGEALWMYTAGAAHASFDEASKGTIEVGKLADLAVLSADPTTTPLEELREITVEMTILSGEVVWEGGE